MTHKWGKITQMDDKWHIGVGWVLLLEIVDKMMPKDTWDYREKYGRLRIDIYEPTDYSYDLANRIETLSALICENCGEYGKMRSDGWNKTLCDDCDKAWRE